MLYSTSFTGESLDGCIMYIKIEEYVVVRWITDGRHRRSRDAPGEEESGREAVELMGRAGSFSWGGLGQIRGPGILGRSCGD